MQGARRPLARVSSMATTAAILLIVAGAKVFGKAIALYRKVIERKPSYGPAYLELAAILIRDAHYDRAAALLGRGLLEVVDDLGFTGRRTAVEDEDGKNTGHGFLDSLFRG